MPEYKDMLSLNVMHGVGVTVGVPFLGCAIPVSPKPTGLSVITLVNKLHKNE